MPEVLRVGLVTRKLQKICGVPIEVLLVFQDVGVVLENSTPEVFGVLHSGHWQILDVIENIHMVVVILIVALDRSQGLLKTVGLQKDVWVLGDSMSLEKVL